MNIFALLYFVLALEWSIYCVITKIKSNKKKLTTNEAIWFFLLNYTFAPITLILNIISLFKNRYKVVWTDRTINHQ